MCQSHAQTLPVWAEGIHLMQRRTCHHCSAVPSWLFCAITEVPCHHCDAVPSHRFHAIMVVMCHCVCALQLWQCHAITVVLGNPWAAVSSQMFHAIMTMPCHHCGMCCGTKQWSLSKQIHCWHNHHWQLLVPGIRMCL